MLRPATRSLTKKLLHNEAPVTTVRKIQTITGRDAKPSNKVKGEVKLKVKKQIKAKESKVKVKKVNLSYRKLDSEYKPTVNVSHFNDINTILSYLQKNDELLANVTVKEFDDCYLFNKKLDLPNLDDGIPFTYKSLFRSIIFQQLAGKAAQSILNKVLNHYNHDKSLEKNKEIVFQVDKSTKFPTPQQILETDHETLRSLGLSNNKAKFLKDLSQFYQDGKLNDEILMESDDLDVFELLIQVKGIGPWTVDMFLMFCLKRKDVFPVGDLAIQKGVMKHFGRKSITEQEMLDLSQRWRPFRSIVTWYLWEVASTVTLEK